MLEKIGGDRDTKIEQGMTGYEKNALSVQAKASTTVFLVLLILHPQGPS